MGGPHFDAEPHHPVLPRLGPSPKNRTIHSVQLRDSGLPIFLNLHPRHAAMGVHVHSI